MDAAVSAARRGWRGDPSGNGCGYTKAGVILDDLLAEAGPTIAPIESYNSEVGVPLTVTRVDITVAALTSTSTRSNTRRVIA